MTTSARRTNWSIRLVAGAAFVNGMLGILQVLLVRVSEPPRLFSLVLPFGLHHWSKLLTLSTSFLLVIISYHLSMRRRTAWYLGMAALTLATLAHFGHGHHVYFAFAPAATGVLLASQRRHFTVRTEPHSIKHGVLLMLGSIVIALAYGTAGFWLLDKSDFGLNFRWIDAGTRTLRAFFLVGNPDLVPYTRHARLFLDSLGLMGFTAAIIAAFSLFRPLAYRLGTLPRERALVSNILQQHGRSSLDYFKLWPDKSYFFTADRRCCVAYRAAWGVAISLGDPIGPENELETCVRDFAHLCSDNGWRIAFHQVLPNLLDTYRKVGLQVIKVGEEAVIDLQTFAGRTQSSGKFRRVRTRAKMLGLTVTRHMPPHPTDLVEETHQISNEWLSIPGRRERTFTLGQFDRSYVKRTPLYVLRDASGHGFAFLNIIPSWPAGHTTIDLMRHRVEIPNGAMDFLFIEVMVALSKEARHFNLGLAPLAGVGDRPGATLEERAIHLLYEHLNRFFSYKGLRAYKAKFEPIWEERFLVYEGGPPGLLNAAIALTRITEGGATKG